MQKELTEEKANTVDIKHFISLIRKCKEPTEISDLMFAELIDKIVVYEAEGVGKARTQKVDIFSTMWGRSILPTQKKNLLKSRHRKNRLKWNDWQNSVSVKKFTERSERRKNR